MIEVRSLTVAYGGTIALDAIDLDIGPGVTGLFGPNGSGKTTLLRVLSGLLRPTSGSASIDSVPVPLAREELRRRLGYAGHKDGLYGHLSVRENLELFARLYGIPARRVDHVLGMVGLLEEASMPARELSAGFGRRAAVARALLHEPDFLLLDEPYANLDDGAAERVSQAIVEWCSDGRTALIATHGAKVVKRFADGGIILKRGRVVTSGRYASRSAPAHP
jgi:heme ABC exporter ATP-binding subunit CcmA